MKIKKTLHCNIPIYQCTHTLTPSEVSQLFKTWRKVPDAMLFFSFVRDFGFTEAVLKASRCDLKYQRPLQALLAMWNEQQSTGKLQSWETALEAAHDALERKKSRAARLRAAIRLFSEKIANKEPWPLQR